MRSWEYNRFGVLMGASSLASCPRWPSLRGYSWPMITLFSLQGDFCATANFLFEHPLFCPSLQGETRGREGLRRVHNRVDLSARTWYSHALWQPQGSESTKTPSSRSSAITGSRARSHFSD